LLQKKFCRSGGSGRRGEKRGSDLRSTWVKKEKGRRHRGEEVNANLVFVSRGARGGGTCQDARRKSLMTPSWTPEEESRGRLLKLINSLHIQASLRITKKVASFFGAKKRKRTMPVNKWGGGVRMERLV